MSNAVLNRSIERFRRGHAVEAADAEHLLDALITSTDETMIAGLLTAWHEKGIEQDEIFLFAEIMRSRCTKVIARHDRVVDIVGTGGSRAKTFNVSTAAAFVSAGAGVAVAKHGNRAATSASGSADVLHELGIDPAADAATAERCLNEIGICFMFAPGFHRLSATLSKVRRGLGFPTIFNCVGPLCNPAGALHQIIGVWDRSLVQKMARALARLGTARSWIVHGNGGLDEIACHGSTAVAEVLGETVRTFEIEPSDFGAEESALGQDVCKTPAASAAIVREILENKPVPGGSLVAMNAAAALFVSGIVPDLADGLRMASESIRNGSARTKLDELAEETRTRK